jgi:hypothetical protein
MVLNPKNHTAACEAGLFQLNYVRNTWPWNILWRLTNLNPTECIGDE